MEKNEYQSLVNKNVEQDHQISYLNQRIDQLEEILSTILEEKQKQQEQTEEDSENEVRLA